MLKCGKFHSRDIIISVVMRKKTLGDGGTDFQGKKKAK